MTVETPPSPHHWIEIAADLSTSPGVHRPSRFSALLASAVQDAAGQVVVDAGCGAGLVTVAALTAGAKHVVAQDYDPACLVDTAANVKRLLGREARDRLTLWEADWRQLEPMHADVLAVNPPQRPTELLPDVETDVLHLHRGGGPDGLDALRLILRHANSTRVRTTAAAVLNLPAAAGGLCGTRWTAPVTVAHTTLPLDRAWRRLAGDLTDRVDVWEFVRRDTVATPTP